MQEEENVGIVENEPNKQNLPEESNRTLHDEGVSSLNPSDEQNNSMTDVSLPMPWPSVTCTEIPEQNAVQLEFEIHTGKHPTPQKLADITYSRCEEGLKIESLENVFGFRTLLLKGDIITKIINQENNICVDFDAEDSRTNLKSMNKVAVYVRRDKYVHEKKGKRMLERKVRDFFAKLRDKEKKEQKLKRKRGSKPHHLKSRENMALKRHVYNEIHKTFNSLRSNGMKLLGHPELIKFQERVTQSFYHRIDNVDSDFRWIIENIKTEFPDDDKVCGEINELVDAYSAAFEVAKTATVEYLKTKPKSVCSGRKAPPCCRNSFQLNAFFTDMYKVTEDDPIAYSVLSEFLVSVLLLTDKYGRDVSQSFMLQPPVYQDNGYYEVIQVPIDLQTIASRIRQFFYTCLNDLKNDFMLMWYNAKVYKDSQRGTTNFKNALTQFKNTEKTKLYVNAKVEFLLQCGKQQIDKRMIEFCDSCMDNLLAQSNELPPHKPDSKDMWKCVYRYRSMLFHLYFNVMSKVYRSCNAEILSFFENPCALKNYDSLENKPKSIKFLFSKIEYCEYLNLQDFVDELTLLLNCISTEYKECGIDKIIFDVNEELKYFVKKYGLSGIQTPLPQYNIKVKYTTEYQAVCRSYYETKDKEEVETSAYSFFNIKKYAGCFNGLPANGLTLYKNVMQAKLWSEIPFHNRNLPFVHQLIDEKWFDEPANIKKHFDDICERVHQKNRLTSGYEMIYECLWLDCDYQFLARGPLVQHISSVHVTSELEHFKCLWVICFEQNVNKSNGMFQRKKPFESRAALLDHIKREHLHEVCVKSDSLSENFVLPPTKRLLANKVRKKRVASLAEESLMNDNSAINTSQVESDNRVVTSYVIANKRPKTITFAVNKKLGSVALPQFYKATTTNVIQLEKCSKELSESKVLLQMPQVPGPVVPKFIRLEHCYGSTSTNQSIMVPMFPPTTDASPSDRNLPLNPPLIHQPSEEESKPTLFDLLKEESDRIF